MRIVVGVPNTSISAFELLSKDFLSKVLVLSHMGAPSRKVAVIGISTRVFTHRYGITLA